MKKKNMMPMVLAAEIVLFILFYYYGSHGLKAIYGLAAENEVVEQSILKERHEIAQLEKEIELWASDPFYKEKLAREKLHMAQDNEEVYLL